MTSPATNVEASVAEEPAPSMSLRRRYPLPRIRSLAPTLVRPIRGGAAVVALGAVVSALVLTGPHAAHPAVYATAHRSVAGERTPAGISLPDVTGTLRLFGLGTDAQRAARASRSATRTAPHSWVRPNWGPMSSPFGYRWGRLHAGVDLAGPWGSTIVAATAGCIAYAGGMSGYGEVIEIADWDGTETVYGHMSSFIRTSGCVHAGEPIARVGESGDATGPHLHFEIRVDGVPIDPVPFLARRGVYL